MNMKNNLTSPIESVTAELIEDTTGLTLAELSLSFRISDAEIWELVDEGIIEPYTQDAGQWRFHGASLWRVRCALQLHRDLGVNWAGAALALELLDELKQLRALAKHYEGV
jgi:chaperone modulatory protein CbpM